jgi:hypothetical protein
MLTEIIPEIIQEPTKAGCAPGDETIGYFAGEISRLRSHLRSARHAPGSSPLPLLGLSDRSRVEIAIRNLHRMLGRKYRTSPLWALVSDVWGHGSTVSGEICIACGFDPCQPCSAKKLTPNTK